jgi:hypothetical protein
MLHDWINTIRAFNYHKVQYVVVGGLAVAAHGAPRQAADLDLLVSPLHSNVRLVRSALVSLGFKLPRYPLVFEGDALMLGTPPLRIDITTSLTGVHVHEAIRSAVPVPFDGTHVPVLSFELLLQSKQAAGRFKDLEDVAKLLAVREARLGGGSAGV